MNKPNFNINKKENRIKFKINPEFYNLDVIYGACYAFVDKAYLYLDGDPEDEIEVYLKGKEELKKEELKNLAGEFLNELINVALRYKISDKNKKIREYIVSAALIGVSGELKSEMRNQRKEVEREVEPPKWEKDPKDIAVPWEEKNKDNEDSPEWKEDPENIAVPWKEKHNEKKLYKKNSEGVIVPWKEE